MPAFRVYGEMAAARRKELPSRLGFALFLAVSSGCLTRDIGPLIWLLAVAVSQGLDALLTVSLLRPERVSPWRGLTYASVVLLSGVVFTSIAVYTWFAGGAAGQIFAMLIPAGALINAVLNAQRAPQSTLPIWLPHGLCLLGLPIVSAAISPQPDMLGMVAVSVGAGVYIVHLLLTVRRILDEKARRERAAAELDETRSTLASFVATVPGAVMMADREMRVLQASPTWLASFGVTLEAARGRTVYEINHDYFARFRDSFERCLTGEKVQAPQVRTQAPDGTLQYLRAELTPWRDADGQVGGVIISALDISDMVEALSRTERSQQRLKLAVEIADLHVWECDYIRQTVETEGAADTFFDYPVEPMVLLQDTDQTIDPRDRALIADEWAAAVEADLPYRPEYRINRLDGKEVWATCTVKLIRDADGHPIRLIGAMQNITDRKIGEAALLRAKEEAEAANRAKSTFLATISHEIRTPLNGVIGMAQAMETDELSAEQRERLTVIRRSGEALLAILNDVLDLSKIEAGKLEIEHADFDLSPLMVGAHATFTAIAESKGLDFSLTVAPSAVGRYRSDATRIRQIVYNLISNALKFTETGAVGIRVDHDGDVLTVEVTDTGMGMSPDVLTRLFNKFEQADASTTRRFGGTGLGLAICNELADRLGGSVSATSLEGRGSTFRLDLPLARIGDEQPPQGAPNEGAASRADLLSLRVLAAEDNAINQLVLKTLLQQVGVEPVLALDGKAALEAWRNGSWDVVLMDVHMPVLDGLDATRIIREEERRTGRPRTPILALTADTLAHQIDEYARVGMDGYVAKPIDAAKLFAALAETVSDGVARDALGLKA